MNHLLCFGLGYSAEALAKRLAAEGWTISGTATTAEGAERIAARGYEAFHFDGTAPVVGLDRAIARATHVLMSAPPDEAGDPALRIYGRDLAASAPLRWLGYLGTVGVYGDWQGAWVDETCELRTANQRSLWRIAAEKAWIDLVASSGKTAVVFRLAGIYGPGRGPLSNVLRGTAQRIVKPGQVFSRIHRDDIAGVVAAAIACQPQHTIYNVCDDEPARPQDVIAFATEQLGLPMLPEIPFEAAGLSPMQGSFYSENRRISNARAKGDLKWTLLYPTYREGIIADLRLAGRIPR